VRALGKLGYTNVSANYRLTRQGTWPAQVHDTKAAIRWVRANAAKIGIDPDKIAIAGYSAGWLLSLLAAGTAWPSSKAAAATPASVRTCRPASESIHWRVFRLQAACFRTH